MLCRSLRGRGERRHARGDVEAVGTFLLDGTFAGTWRIKRSDDRAMLTIRPFEPIDPADEVALTDEGNRLVAFATNGLAAEIVVERPSA